jgi:hypothetical protein
MYFHWIWNRGVLLNFIDTFQFWLKSDNNNGHFTWRLICNFLSDLPKSVVYVNQPRMPKNLQDKIQGYSKRSIHFQKFILQFYRTYGDVLYIDWRENSQSYFHTLQALDVSPTCDAADVKPIIQLFPHSSQHVTGNSSHSLSDAPLQIIDIRTLRYFLSIRTPDMDLASVVL